ncbi:MAG: NAD(+) diphosphatase [Bacteroidota bacterium]
MTSSPRMFYSRSAIDRSALLRKDEQWLKNSLQNESLALPVWQNHNLFDTQGKTTPEFLWLDLNQNLLSASSETVFLGLYDQKPLYTIDLSHLDLEQAQLIVGRGKFLDLRKVSKRLDPDHASLMAYARGILQWHRNHPFCSRCGQSTQSSDGGHIRVCTHDPCKTVSYPRIDPAVIVLVEHVPAHGEPMCLLARSRNIPKNIFSTLAGFAEPGESLEEALKREVKEEVGLDIHSPRYIASQSWPFPASMMIGFYAQSNNTSLQLDPAEIEEARWFTVSEILEAVENGSLILSKDDSIAQFLIKNWVEETLHKKIDRPALEPQTDLSK